MVIQSGPDEVEFESWKIAKETFREVKGERKVGQKRLQ